MEELSEEQFCKLHTQYNGEEIDNIKQLVSETFTGEELLEFINYILKQKS